MAGSKLIFRVLRAFAYELDDDGKVKVNPDGTISVDWWLREDDEWHPWMSNTFTRTDG